MCELVDFECDESDSWLDVAEAPGGDEKLEKEQMLCLCSSELKCFTVCVTCEIGHRPTKHS